MDDGHTVECPFFVVVLQHDIFFSAIANLTQAN